MIIRTLYHTSGINKEPAVCANYTVTCCRRDPQTENERSSEIPLPCRMSTASEKSPDKQLFAACISGDLGVVERIVRDENLIERINAITDDRGRTPLHHACE